MQPLQTIVAIAMDDALLRSLAFALGVEGYSVQPYNTWHAARAMMATSICVIVDIDICRDDADARRSLLDPESRIVLLSDGMPPPALSPSVCVIPKPLDGSDILVGVDQFRRAHT
ncbi:transcriptional regulator [Rhizobium sp. 32-5/1]|uniref:transcriptional regulator n=1 Tax=Rhizobium sp. 32-5/1 TaxID=3019602 RepID=UPI00240E354B|nr:transcriptional regulator [Rhizobium sp. 32-5/1]WEZ84910.1 transcriptional regulator [Rhizobium sp. 32-5/1]